MFLCHQSLLVLLSPQLYLLRGVSDILAKPSLLIPYLLLRPGLPSSEHKESPPRILYPISAPQTAPKQLSESVAFS